MGEPNKKYQPVDLLEFKRRLRARVESASANSMSEDPLAELARIVGGEGRILPNSVEGADELFPKGSKTFGEQPAPPEAAVAPIYRASAEDGIANPPAVETPYDHSADFHEAAEEAWPGFDETHVHANEDFAVDPTSRAHLRLRNHNRHRISLYATAAAIFVVSGVLVAVFGRPGVSVGVAPTIRTVAAAAVASKIPAAAVSAAPSDPSAMPDAAAVSDSSIQLSNTSPLNTVGNSAAIAASAGAAAPPADASPVTSDDSLFSPSRRVRSIPIYSDGSFMDPAKRATPAGDQLASAGAAPAQAAEAQSFQSPPSSVAARPRVNNTASQTPPAENVASRESPPANVHARSAARTVPAAAQGGRNFEAVLASPSSESEARGMLSTLQQKYGPALAGYRLTFHHVKHTGQTGYEVRVAGLANDAAQTLCDKLTKAGGSCEVTSQ
jgi:hypothetical protein